MAAKASDSNPSTFSGSPLPQPSPVGHSETLNRTPPLPTAPLLESKSTPIRTHRNTTYPFTSTHKHRDKDQAEIGFDMLNSFVGPMPPGEFLDYFFPSSDPPCSFEVGTFHRVLSAQKETEMYDPFVSFLSHTALFFLNI
jgi:hypothetical protein